MKLTVLGCHGGESKKHRATSFLLDGRMAIDAGALTRALTLDEQLRVGSVVVSHAHFDHVRDLAMAADNRCQVGAPTLEVAGAKATLDALRKHFFNDVLWPDFTKIPSGDGPTVRFRELELETPTMVAGYEITAVPVTHTIDAVGFFIRGAEGTLAFSGDTGPTQRFWEVCNATPDLRSILLEVSFPDEHEEMALTTGHLSPALAMRELAKLDASKQAAKVYFHHLKPPFEQQTRDELAAVDDRFSRVCRLDDEFEIG